MTKYIILTLYLVVVLGCSDDNSTNLDNNDKFPLIEGMFYKDELGKARSIMGDESNLRLPCVNGNVSEINAYPNTTENNMNIEVFTEEDQEISIYLETARVSQELLDEIIIEYKDRVPKHDTYLEFKILDLAIMAGLNNMTLTVQELTPGPYLLKVIRENGEEQCIPVLVATPLIDNN